MKSLQISAIVLVVAQLSVVLSQTVLYGPETEFSNDAYAEVTCPAGTVGVKCECEPWASCDGSFFLADGTCRAYCSGFGVKVKPKVTCEAETPGVSYTNVRGPATGRSSRPEATCPEGTELVSCSIHSYWLPYYSGITASVVGNTCTTSLQCGSTGSQGCTAHATCKAVEDVQVEPCKEGTYEPVEGSPDQYLYCGEDGVWYQMQCPCKEVFFPETNTCGPEECRAVFDSEPATPPSEEVDNPCTAEAIAAGATSHTYGPDHTMYIECESVGVAIVRPCPPLHIWDVKTTSCRPAAIASTGSYDAPCTKDNISEGNVVHSFRGDNSKFIVCDPNGFSHVMSCPRGERWINGLKRCLRIPSFPRGLPRPQ